MAEFLNKNGLLYFFTKLKNVFASKSELKTINNQLYSTISGVPVNTNTGAMELWSENLNNITKTGLYNAMTCRNAKYQYSTLIVIGYYLNGYCTQIQSDVTSGAVATRTQINGSWTTWKVIS